MQYKSAYRLSIGKNPQSFDLILKSGLELSFLFPSQNKWFVPPTLMWVVFSEEKLSGGLFVARSKWYRVVSYPFTKSISGPRKASYRSERQVSQGRNYHRKGSSDKSKRRRNWVVDWSTFPTLLNKTWTRNYQTHFVKVNEFQNGCFSFISSAPFWTKKYSSLPDNRAANCILILEKVHPTSAY